MEKRYKEVTKMTVSYKKLWKLLIDRDMKKKDLQAAAGISPSSISKLSKKRICQYGRSCKGLYGAWR
jgi:hypothetical protein